MDNRSHPETDWDLELHGFARKEIDGSLAGPDIDDRANLVREVPEHPVTKPGDVLVVPIVIESKN